MSSGGKTPTRRGGGALETGRAPEAPRRGGAPETGRAPKAPRGGGAPETGRTPKAPRGGGAPETGRAPKAPRGGGAPETGRAKAPAGRRAGLVSVARALGVSPSTVSNAYNRPDQLSPALRQRVLATAAELGYAGPDPVARSLRSGRAGAVGLVFYERLAYAFNDPAAVRFLQGASEAIDEQQLAMVLVPGPYGRPAREPALRTAAVDGFIAHGLPADDPLLEATLSRRLPTVIVDSQPVPGFDFVGIDDRLAAESAIAYLLELGHRRIGILSFRLEEGSDPLASTGRPDSVGQRRLEGCAHALRHAGLAWADVTVEPCPAVSPEAGEAGLAAVLDRAPETTAVFAFSDVLALGAKRAAEALGLQVPRHLSIVGFDGTAPAAEALTSVHQPQREKGRLAAERLITAFGPEPAPPASTLLPTRLVEAGSTAAPQ
jgi:DNA-binding LacI/PurR family transcriptional regulator